VVGLICKFPLVVGLRDCSLIVELDISISV
jgi:hypothetical protein